MVGTSNALTWAYTRPIGKPLFGIL